MPSIRGEYDDSLNKPKSAQIGTWVRILARYIESNKIYDRFRMDRSHAADGRRDNYDVSEIELNLAAYYYRQ